MDSLPTSSSITRTPALFSMSGSGSFHSRLTVSSSSSQRRLRALSMQLDVDELTGEHDYKPPSPRSVVTSSTPPSPTLPTHVHIRGPQMQKRSLLYYGFLVYCLVSFVLFTCHLLDLLHVDSVIGTHPKDQVSPINDISRSHLLTKLLSGRLHPLPFYPNAYVDPFNTFVADEDITACLWVNISELPDLESALEFWKGPLSIVLVEDTSSAKKHRLSKILKKTPNIRKAAAIHILQEEPPVYRSANAYLNLARLFATTRHVVLFSSSSQFNDSRNMYHNLRDGFGSSNKSELISPSLLLVGERTVSKPSEYYSPQSFSLYLNRDYPVWCTERFFITSREAQWQECIWQFWLYSFGSLPVLGGNLEMPSIQNKRPVSVETSVYRRLSNRFRHETCMLAANTLKESSPHRRKVDPYKARWVRKICKEAVDWSED